RAVIRRLEPLLSSGFHSRHRSSEGERDSVHTSLQSTLINVFSISHERRGHDYGSMRVSGKTARQHQLSCGTVCSEDNPIDRSIGRRERLAATVARRVFCIIRSGCCWRRQISRRITSLRSKGFDSLISKKSPFF